MVKVSQAKKVSAFAVIQHEKGKMKLDPSVESEVANSVEKLHSDAKFNKKVDYIARKFEKNEQTHKKRKAKKKKAMKDAIKNSLKSGVLNTQSQNPRKEEQKPLNWYGAPTSGKKKQKLVASSESTPESLRHSKNNKKKQTKSHLDHFDENAATRPLPRPNPKNYKGQPIDASLVDAKKKKTKKIGLPEWNSDFKTQALSNGDMDNDHRKNGVGNSRPDDKAGKNKKPSAVPDLVYNAEESESDFSSMDVEHDDPSENGKKLFAKLIHPHNPTEFFGSFWLKRPLLIKRKDPSYYEEDNWFSTMELDRILLEESVRFGVNIDLTSYRDGKRETHNPSGRAYPAIVWDHYQELFGCMVGANVYLTPPGTQGFAPHFDDIEAFILQLEGKKHWKVYGPRSDADVWPLISSRNMSQEELGKPILDCVLEPGDLLYFPRGAIHQAMAQDDGHSLHITVSTHQRNTWGDLLQQMIPAALANAIEQDAEFRESLPNDYLNYTGIAFQEQEGASRSRFLEKLQKLFEKLTNYAPVDGACDLMAKKFMHDALPPVLSETERAHSVAEQGEKWVDGGVREAVELEPATKIRLLRKHCLRIVNESTDEEESSSAGDNSEENVIRIYYNTDNDRFYHGNSLQYFEVDSELAPAVEFLQLNFPEFTSIDDLPLEDITNKVDIAMQLYDKGVIITKDLLISDDMYELIDSGEEEKEADTDNNSDVEG